ncbi:hypothetical protein Tco_0898590 [Tanacetum coccineum]
MIQVLPSFVYAVTNGGDGDDGGDGGGPLKLFQVSIMWRNCDIKAPYMGMGLMFLLYSHVTSEATLRTYDPTTIKIIGPPISV